MRKYRLLIACALVMLITACESISPEMMNSAINVANTVLSNSSQPSSSESANAIKQALDKGVDAAVTQLGQSGGFSDSKYKIPLPAQIQSAADFARDVGLSSYVDEFESSLNNAAEKAVPTAASVFGKAITQMSINDAVNILTGPDNAATEYFIKTSKAEIMQEFLPLVTQATSQVGVTEQFKGLSDKVNTYGRLAGVDMPSIDIDEYVAQQATNSLFDLVAEEEKKIRENPMQRTTELLQKVFGYYGK